MIISKDAEKLSTEMSIHDKNFHQSVYRENIPQHNKGHLNPQPTSYSTVKS